MFISTPAGRNWFYDMFTRGVERQDGFRSFTFPSNVSPYFPAKEWEEVRRTLSGGSSTRRARSKRARIRDVEPPV